jgi:hypothetical protein
MTDINDLIINTNNTITSINYIVTSTDNISTGINNTITDINNTIISIKSNIICTFLSTIKNAFLLQLKKLIFFVLANTLTVIKQYIQNII